MKSLEESMIIIFIFFCKSPTNVQYNMEASICGRKNKETNKPTEQQLLLLLIYIEGLMLYYICLDKVTEHFVYNTHLPNRLFIVKM